MSNILTDNWQLLDEVEQNIVEKYIKYYRVRHEQNIIYNQTKLNHIVHEQTIICT